MGLTDLKPQAEKRNEKQMLEHLRSFELDLKFSAGIWFFSPAASRFHDKYYDDEDIAGRLEKAASLYDYGLRGIEAHYPNEINEENLHIWKKFSNDTGIKILSVIPLLFYPQKFEWGSLSNPIKEKRKEAIELLKRVLEMNRELNTQFAVIWPGIDGYENPFGIDFASMRERFIDGAAEAMDAVPGVRIAFEPKPYEPRGHILFGTTPEGVLLCRMIEERLENSDNKKILENGDALCTLNPEIGHALMAYEDLAYAYSWALAEGRLAHIHMNSQPLGNYDQDLNVGVIAPEQLEALMYVLKMHGYSEYFGIDINPERMPVERALRNSIDAVRAANDRINGLDHEQIMYAVDNPDKARGWLEAYLIRKRAPGSSKLPPLEDVKDFR